MKEERLLRLIKETRKLNTLGAARSVQQRFIKPAAILQGDDGKFWVAHIGPAAVLHKAGYEIIR